MLILTRKTNETIVIGNNVFLTVLGTTGNHVRIGITAPNNVSVHRKEIFLKVSNESFALEKPKPLTSIRYKTTKNIHLNQTTNTH